MKTTSILAATVAAFLLASGPSLAAEPQQPQAPTQTQPSTQTQPQAKRCYRHFHKLPYRIRVRCRKPKTEMPTKSETEIRQPALEQNS